MTRRSLWLPFRPLSLASVRSTAPRSSTRWTSASWNASASRRSERTSARSTRVRAGLVTGMPSRMARSSSARVARAMENDARTHDLRPRSGDLDLAEPARTTAQHGTGGAVAEEQPLAHRPDTAARSRALGVSAIVSRPRTPLGGAGEALPVRTRRPIESFVRRQTERAGCSETTPYWRPARRAIARRSRECVSGFLVVCATTRAHAPKRAASRATAQRANVTGG